mmetsp:Transcript_10137/g.24810  ORF Transcript_10137/g.24810 Transcript_10137/m.24810 type:complete len:524 (+) Transcript_10137:671-2242(+)
MKDAPNGGQLPLHALELVVVQVQAVPVDVLLRAEALLLVEGRVGAVAAQGPAHAFPVHPVDLIEQNRLIVEGCRRLSLIHHVEAVSDGGGVDRVEREGCARRCRKVLLDFDVGGDGGLLGGNADGVVLAERWHLGDPGEARLEVVQPQNRGLLLERGERGGEVPRVERDKEQCEQELSEDDDAACVGCGRLVRRAQHQRHGPVTSIVDLGEPPAALPVRRDAPERVVGAVSLAYHEQNRAERELGKHEHPQAELKGLRPRHEDRLRLALERHEREALGHEGRHHHVLGHRLRRDLVGPGGKARVVGAPARHVRPQVLPCGVVEHLEGIRGRTLIALARLLMYRRLAREVVFQFDVQLRRNLLQQLDREASNVSVGRGPRLIDVPRVNQPLLVGDSHEGQDLVDDHLVRLACQRTDRSTQRRRDPLGWRIIVEVPSQVSFARILSLPPFPLPGRGRKSSPPRRQELTPQGLQLSRAQHFPMRLQLGEQHLDALYLALRGVHRAVSQISLRPRYNAQRQRSAQRC